MRSINNQYKRANLHLFFLFYSLNYNMKLSTLSFALLTAASYINLGSAQENVLDLVQTFREPKNILFSVNMGGSSHVLWVLSILEELAARGHHVKFFTRVMNL
jgi:hypothetical protein